MNSGTLGRKRQIWVLDRLRFETGAFEQVFGSKASGEITLSGARARLTLSEDAVSGDLPGRGGARRCVNRSVSASGLNGLRRLVVGTLTAAQSL